MFANFSKARVLKCEEMCKEIGWSVENMKNVKRNRLECLECE